jgi:PPOX class probable F420-dependent enzyme
MGRKKLARANYLSFETFRKSGVGVATPVWFAEEDGVFYLFSANEAGKIKRLRNSPRSRIAACTVSGRVTGEWVDTQAYMLDETEPALGALRRKYGWQMKLTDCMSRLSGKMDKRTYIAVKTTSAD